MVDQVESCYLNKDQVLGGFMYLFDEDIKTLCKRTTQYLHTQVALYRLDLMKKVANIKTITNVSKKSKNGTVRNNGYNNTKHGGVATGCKKIFRGLHKVGREGG